MRIEAAEKMVKSLQDGNTFEIVLEEYANGDAKMGLYMVEGDILLDDGQCYPPTLTPAQAVNAVCEYLDDEGKPALYCEG